MVDGKQQHKILEPVRCWLDKYNKKLENQTSS